MDYVICLCYSSEKGFYTKYSSAPCGEDDVIFRSHEKRGYQDHRITVSEAETKIEINISTNFGYGHVSYLLTTISKNGLPILDFSTEKIYVINHEDVQTFVAPPKDWSNLFMQIINAIHNFQSEQYYAAAKKYVDELSKIAQTQSLTIKRFLYSGESPTRWNKKSMILLVMSDRINNLLGQLMSAKVDRRDLISTCIELCQQYLKAIAKNYPLFDLSDSRASRIEDALLIVHQFLHVQKLSNLFTETIVAHPLKDAE